MENNKNKYKRGDCILLEDNRIVEILSRYVEMPEFYIIRFLNWGSRIPTYVKEEQLLKGRMIEEYDKL